jgi:hypothetical protein
MRSKVSSFWAMACTGRGIVYPWIANMGQRGRRSNPYLVHDAKLGEAIQVRGYGSWADGTGRVGVIDLATTAL